MEMTEVKTKGEAQNAAIEWQAWASTQALSWSELLEWQDYFEQIARKFDLIDEFKENGII